MARRAPVESIAPIERDAAPSLVEAIGERVERMIISGEISSGGKLNEYALAQQLQVSRSALREAVRLLERSGLVTVLPNRGVFVRQVSLQQALDLFDVRAGLAYTAGRLAATRATDEQIDQLAQLHQDMVRVYEAREISKYYELNLAFHSAVMTQAGNDRLASLYDMMSNELHLFRRRNLGHSAQIEVSIQEHAKILESIQAHDASKAARAFERHILLGKQRMLDTLSLCAT